MKRILFIILTLFLSMSIVDASAQGFLDRVKKTVKKEVENRVNKEVKKQVNKSFDKGIEAISGDKEKPEPPKSKSNRPQAQSSQPQASNASSKESREERNERHIQKLVERGVAIRTVKPAETPQNTAPATGKTNGHEWVDLGLPSGVRWATCNVGVTKPEQPGSLYAWGELTTKTNFVSENNKTYHKDMDDISGNATYDLAAAKWGKGWRMPTKAEYDELLLHCNYSYVERGGIKGHEFTNPNNNRSIFLPATGFKEGSSKHQLATTNGMYWTSTPHKDKVNNGSHVYIFGNALGEMSIAERYTGAGVRAVSDNDALINTPASGETNGHKWVDLGLPSGTKWATCNVGAATSEHFGNTYYWGSISPYIDYHSEDTPIKDTKVDDISGNPKYDPATVAWGKEWRMPTLEQFKELMFNCTWECTTLGRLNGFKVISKINGNYIFFPIEMYGKVGSYWTSTPGIATHNTNQIFMDKAYISFSTTYRKENKPIRAVTK